MANHSGDKVNAFNERFDAFRRMSIRYKLILIIMLVSCISISLAGSSLIIYEFLSFRERMVTDLSSLASMIADNCQASLSFDDPDDAEEVLSSLEKKAAIELAIVYKSNGAVFACYNHEKNTPVNLPPNLNQVGHSFFEKHLHIQRPVLFSGLPIGSVYIKSNLSELRSFLKRSVAALILVVMLAIVTAYILAIKLQKVISTPLFRLADVARTITTNRDYSARAAKQSEDELGFLTEAFNDMLSQVERRDTALRESEKQFRTFVEQAADAFFLIDPDTAEFVDVNRNACEVLKYSREEMLTLSVQDIDPSEQKGQFRESTRVLNLGDTITIEAIHKRRDGVTFPVEIRASLIEIRGKKRILALARDISERKQLESRILQAQKMEAIGTLAGGIAHDFNNILSPIIGYTTLLLEDIPEGTQHDSLDEIYTAALRARDLVKQILTFSRHDSDEIKLIKIQPIIKEALKLIRSTIPTSIVIKQDISNNCGSIKADPTQIHQIVMNLATNAYHAMEDAGGELTVTLEEVELGSQDLVIQDMEPGPYACLSIADTGIGMEKDLINKIFDPFYTTKERSKGTGMGLSVVHGIVKNAGGGINVYSEPGKGTNFHIYLPVVKSPSGQQEIQKKELIPVGTERILLVDDETAIITMEKKMLERLGYQVVALTSSLEALETFRKNPGNFDMVITDMAMPNMTGNKLSMELIKIRPDIPIIICSGFSEQMSIEKAEALGIKGFLIKPVLRKDLSKKVREILDRK